MLPRCVASHGGERPGATPRPCPTLARSGGPIPRRVERPGPAWDRRGDGRAGRIRCRGPRSTRPGRRPFDRAGSCALSRSGLSPESRSPRGGPTPQAGFPPVRPRRPPDRGCIARRIATRERINTQEYISLRARESVPAPIAACQSNRTSSKSGPLMSRRASTRGPSTSRLQFVRPILRETLHILRKAASRRAIVAPARPRSTRAAA